MFTATSLQFFSHFQFGEILGLSCLVSPLEIVHTTQAAQRSLCVDFGTVGLSFVSAVPCREHIVTDLEGGCQFVCFVFFFFLFVVGGSLYVRRSTTAMRMPIV